MVLDTSALFAIFASEPEAELFEAAIADAPRRLISTATLVECGIVVLSRFGDAGAHELDLWVHQAKLQQMPVTEEHAQIARRAFQAFGKGRHRAALNLGDCFSYALAVAEGEPLLFKGQDFAFTDVIPVLK